MMAPRERPVDRAARVSRKIQLAVATELRDARLAAGLSQQSVGRAAGISHAQVGRVERGAVSGLTIAQLGGIATALGLDLSVRFFPGGDPLRDAAQSSLLERLRQRIHVSLKWQTEVALPIEGDRRAWDALIGSSNERTAVEPETRVSDGQALARKLSLKRRDGRIERVILLIADTRRNRAALISWREALRSDFPLDSREILRALQEGRHPPDSGIVVL